MAEEFTHVRVRVSTRAKLLELAERMAESYTRTGAGALVPVEGRISADALIVWLIGQDAKHRERAAAQRRRKRDQGPPVAG
jgi:hypothetical protein